jgi:hypothetical protein
MSEAAIRNYAAEKDFRPQTLERWLSWAQADRDALAEVAVGLKISENHLRELMDWLEEIALRDGSAIHETLGDKAIVEIRTDARLGRADRVRKIKEELWRRRFPRLAETEKAIQKQIRELKLHPELLVSVPPGLEGGKLAVAFAAASQDEFRRAVKKLGEAAERESLAQIFAMLSGAAREEVGK